MKQKERTRFVPKLQQTKVNSKNNNNAFELNNNIMNTSKIKPEIIIINSDRKEQTININDITGKEQAAFFEGKDTNSYFYL